MLMYFFLQIIYIKINFHASCELIVYWISVIFLRYKRFKVWSRRNQRTESLKIILVIIPCTNLEQNPMHAESQTGFSLRYETVPKIFLCWNKMFGVYLGFFADDTCIYATDRKEGYALRKLQRGLTGIETWCERWDIKISKDKTQIINFSHRLRSYDVHFTWNRWISSLSII
jgi:hypothetical protein